MELSARPRGQTTVEGVEIEEFPQNEEATDVKV
jgi:hypothetical protein